MLYNRKKKKRLSEKRTSFVPFFALSPCCHIPYASQVWHSQQNLHRGLPCRCKMHKNFAMYVSASIKRKDPTMSPQVGAIPIPPSPTTGTQAMCTPRSAPWAQSQGLQLPLTPSEYGVLSSTHICEGRSTRGLAGPADTDQEPSHILGEGTPQETQPKRSPEPCRGQCPSPRLQDFGTNTQQLKELLVR